MVNIASIAKEKNAIRKTIIQKRKEVDDLKKNENSTTISHRLFEMESFKKSKSIFCFLSTAFEVQTDEIIRESLRLGKQVSVPLLDSEEGSLRATRIPSMDIEFVAGRGGFREPTQNFRDIVPFSSLGFVVVPGLAFDAFGNRIGYGGGVYDKFFKKIDKSVVRVAIGYGFQILDLVPHTKLDEPVHFLVTEVITLRCLDA